MSSKHEEFVNVLLSYINKRTDFTADELKAILEIGESKIPICKNETETRKTKCTKYVKPGYDYCPQHLNNSKTKTKASTITDNRSSPHIDIDIDKKEIVKHHDVFVIKGTNMICDEKGNLIQ